MAAASINNTALPDFDEASIDFSIDPDMYTKLDIKKPKQGEENMFDMDKMYRFQLAKDIERIKEVKGSFKTRHGAFMEGRNKDVVYKGMAYAPTLGMNGNFVETQPYYIENQWKSTSQPYGIIAHKRYLEWLANLPKGPTEGEILDRKQRAQDADLWEKIQTGKLERTKKELRAIEREKERKMLREIAEANEVEFVKQRRIKRQLIAREKFEDLRKKPTRREFVASMENWKKGIYEDYDFNKGFPVVLSEQSAALLVARDRSEFETMRPEEKRDPGKFLRGNVAEERNFVKYMVGINFDNAGDYLKERKKQEAAERKRKEAEKLADLNAQRRGGHSGLKIAQAAVEARVAALNQDRVLQSDKPKKNSSTDADAAGPDGDDGGDDDSNSDSSSGSRSSFDSDDGDDNDDDNAAAASDGNGVVVSSENRANGARTLSAHRLPRAKKHRTHLEDLGFAPTPTIGGGSDIHALTAHSSRDKQNSGNMSSDRRQQQRQSKADQRWPFNWSLSGGFGAWRVSSASITPITDGDYHSNTNTNINSNSNSSKRKPRNLMRKTYRYTLRVLHRLRPDVAAHHTLKLYRRMRRARKHYYLTKPGELTPGERHKHHQIKALNLAESVASSKKYHDEQVALDEHEIPTDELLKNSRKKIKELNQSIRRWKNRARTPDDYRQIELLEIRVKNQQETISDRLAREQAARDKVQNLIKNIEANRAALEAMRDDWLERIFKKIRILRTSHAVKKAQEKSERAAQKHYFPHYVTEENSKIVSDLYELRKKEKEKELWYRRQYYRMIGVNMEERERAPTIEDLILATRAGGYVEVMDIAMHDTDPVSPNDVNEDGLTATYVALMMILKREVMDGAGDLEDLTATTWTRLTKAIGLKGKKEVGQMQMVLRILLFNGGRVDHARLEAGVDGMTVMHSAAEMGSIEVLEWMLGMGTSVDIITTIIKKTPLMVALEFDQMEAVLFLLKNGAMLSLEVADSKGWTALHYAAVFARPEAAVVLLICGARTNARNNEGRLPSEEAQAKGRVETASAIITFRPSGVDYMNRLDCMKETQADEYAQYKHTQEHLFGEAFGTSSGSYGFESQPDGATHSTVSLYSGAAAEEKEKEKDKGIGRGLSATSGLNASGKGKTMGTIGETHDEVEEEEEKEEEEEDVGNVVMHSESALMQMYQQQENQNQFYQQQQAQLQHLSAVPIPQPMGAARTEAAQQARVRKTILMQQNVARMEAQAAAEAEKEAQKEAYDQTAMGRASNVFGSVRSRATDFAQSAAATATTAASAASAAALIATASTSSIGGASNGSSSGGGIGGFALSGHLSKTGSTADGEPLWSKKTPVIGGSKTSLHKPKFKLGLTRLSFRPQQQLPQK